MQDGRPAQPQVIGFGRQVIQHLQGVVEIILMPDPVANFNALQIGHLREDDLQQARIEEQLESFRRRFREDDLVEFYGNPFPGDDIYTIAVAGDRRQGFLVNRKVQLTGKANGPQHP